MLHAYVGMVTVRVAPRSRRTGVDVSDAGVVVHVQAAPEGGRATEEARRALARALGLPASAVTLRAGATARTKRFEVSGLARREVEMRLRATPSA
jgi:uncharacterized protein YggU (UPF0235/DUF167 family)